MLLERSQKTGSMNNLQEQTIVIEANVYLNGNDTVKTETLRGTHVEVKDSFLYVKSDELLVGIFKSWDNVRMREFIQEGDE